MIQIASTSMAMLGNVQQKILCVFETKVVNEPTTKRPNQPYKVVAGEELKAEAKDSDIIQSVATEKLDGTCAFVQEFDGRPWLWARLDRKLTKGAQKKFKQFQVSSSILKLDGKKDEKTEPYTWDIKKDFKEVPPNWIPAYGVAKKNGSLQPDDNGHIPGWVPVDQTSRQHLWHLTTVDLDLGVGLVLEKKDDECLCLELKLRSLNDLCGCTMELIGTNVNGNPYKLGSKQQPLHVLVRHGSIPFIDRPPLTLHGLKKWFDESPEGKIEGIVWHCSDGSLFKIHRHHLGLRWPVDQLRLSVLPVDINVDDIKASDSPRFSKLFVLHGRKFETLKDIKFE